MLVPLICAYPPAGVSDSVPTPGAAMSTHWLYVEKEARALVLSTAATLMTWSRAAG